MSGGNLRTWIAAALVGAGVSACGAEAPAAQAQIVAAAASAEQDPPLKKFQRGRYVFPPSFSDWHEGGAEYEACMDASGGITIEMRDCSDAEIVRQDEASARTLTDLKRAKVDPAVTARFEAEDPDWKAERSEFCHMATREEEGTPALLSYTSCVLDITIDRRLEMEALVAASRRN